MPGAQTSAQKMAWGLWKGNYVMESDIIHIIKPKYIIRYIDILMVDSSNGKMYI